MFKKFFLIFKNSKWGLQPASFSPPGSWLEMPCPSGVRTRSAAVLNPSDLQSARLLPAEDKTHKMPCLLAGAHGAGAGGARRLETIVWPPSQAEEQRVRRLWVWWEGKQTRCVKPHHLFQEAFTCPPRQDLAPRLRKHFPCRLAVSPWYHLRRLF